MMDILILRLDAPLMSFGAPIVDRHGEIQPYPALSMITGMLGNALGYDHSDFDKLQRLQERLQYASRQDRAGQEIQDFQTVDISKPHMQAYGRESRAWTTNGKLDNRTNQNKKGDRGPLLRHRDYRADAIHTVALTLDPPRKEPTVNDLQDALQHPERPLFIGRKNCLPATSVLIDRIEEDNLTKALQKVSLPQRADERSSYPAWWPVDDNRDQPRAEMKQPVTDRRDWSNQIHTGERWIAKGEITIDTKEAAHE